MGMSASQARLLSLTARLSDLELQAQQISNAKIRLADEAAEASRAYNSALDKQVFKVENGSNGTFSDANLSNVTTYTGFNMNSTKSRLRYITDTAGKLVMSQGDAAAWGVAINANGTAGYNDASVRTALGITGTTPQDSPLYQYYETVINTLTNRGATVQTNAIANSPEWLEGQVAAGNLYLTEFNPTGGTQGTGSFDQVSWTSGDDSIHQEDDKTELARAEAKYETTMADIQSKDKRFDLKLKTIDTEHQAIQTEMESVKKVIDKNIERSFKIFQA